MLTTRPAAIATTLLLGAGTAGAGVQTLDVVFDYSTNAAFRGILDAGLPTELVSDPMTIGVSGSIAMSVAIDDGQIVGATLTGGTFGSDESITATLDDAGATAEVTLDAPLITFGTSASLVAASMFAERYQVGFRPDAALTGALSTAEDGTLKGGFDLALDADASPDVFGFLTLEGDVLSFTSKFDFTDEGHQSGLTSGKSVGYDLAAEIRSSVIVPAPGTVGALALLGLAARRRR